MIDKAELETQSLIPSEPDHALIPAELPSTDPLYLNHADPALIKIIKDNATHAWKHLHPKRNLIHLDDYRE